MIFKNKFVLSHKLRFDCDEYIKGIVFLMHYVTLAVLPSMASKQTTRVTGFEKKKKRGKSLSKPNSENDMFKCQLGKQPLHFSSFFKRSINYKAC